MKQSREWSFITIALIYLLASALGIYLTIILPYSLWLSLLIADVCATILVFIFSLLLKNASVYDPYWSVQPMVIGVAMTVANKQFSLFNLLLLAVVLVWGLRLTANWAYTFGNLTHQDWRYTMLKEKTNKLYPVVNFVGIHMVPTLVVYLCALPMVFALQQNIPVTWDNFDALLYLAISLGAVTMQGVADLQMHKFRKDKREGKTNETFMRRGLWKHSRHPNYLGEILMWWGVGVAVVKMLHGAQYLWLLCGALANTLLFLFASIPLADGRQSKKQGFEQYKAETFMLLPIPKPAKKTSSTIIEQK